MKRFLSSPFFLLAAAAFFLPFFTVQCASGFGEGFTQGLGEAFGEEAQIPQGDLEETVTGLELVTGEAEDKLSQTTGTADDLPTPGLESPIPGVSSGDAALDLGTVQILAIAAAAAAVLGIALSLLGGRPGGAIALVLGAGGALLLFTLATQFKDAVFGPAQEAENFIEVNNEIGYWAALFLFVLAALAGVVRIVMRDRVAPPVASTGLGAPPEAPSPGPPPPPPPPVAPPLSEPPPP